MRAVDRAGEALASGLAAGFGAAVRVRNLAYDRGLFARRAAGGPVVSVGNLAVGGQGKTPLVELLAGRAEEVGVRIAVVSRGYGRRCRSPAVVSVGRGPVVSADVGGDEPVMLAQSTSAVVLVDGDRVRAARRAFAEFGVDLVILDDGFQHRRLGRDLDLAVLGETPGRLVPRGRFREAVSALRRAHAVVALDGAPLDLHPVTIRGRYRIGHHTQPDGRDRRSVDDLRGRTVALLTGIARGERVQKGLTSMGARVVLHDRGSDHEWFGPRRIEDFRRCAVRAGAELLMTTSKDAARQPLELSGFRVVHGGLVLEEEGRNKLLQLVAQSTGVSRMADSASPEPRPRSA